MAFTSENNAFNKILKAEDLNKSIKELGEELEFASSDLISDSQLLNVIEVFLNKIYRSIKKDNKFEEITEVQMQTFQKILSETKNLNYHKKQKTRTPELFEMARALGERMTLFSGKLKAISIPLITLAQTIDILSN